MAIQWSEKYQVNVQEIDTQHKKLVDLLNSLEAAMASGKGKEVIGPILASTLQYTVYHFGVEEKLMKHHAYLDIDSHLEQHALFTSKVRDFKKQFDSGNKNLSIPTMEFLRTWLVNHIMNTDKALARYLATQGVR